MDYIANPTPAILAVQRCPLCEFDSLYFAGRDQQFKDDFVTLVFSLMSPPSRIDRDRANWDYVCRVRRDNIDGDFSVTPYGCPYPPGSGHFGESPPVYQ